jgi:4-hydroxybenzoate polyprenyltransferase
MDKVRAYAQLLRIPNVFTAMADVCMGWMIVTRFHSGTLEDHSIGYPLPDFTDPVLWLLVLSSSSLYCAGMVWNDFFDVEQDRRERPFRPIPSGRVSRSSAGMIGTLLLGVGVTFAAACRPFAGWLPLGAASLLATLILLYDGLLKHTWAGPVAMGGCRLLNVSLGIVGAGGDIGQGAFFGAIVGLYIVGVTWFARTEAVESRRPILVLATIPMLVAVALSAVLADDGTISSVWGGLYYALLLAWAAIIGRPILAAIISPQPARVQKAVKTCVLGLISLDAVIAFGVVGWPGLLILLLLPPALLLGRWVYST